MSPLYLDYNATTPLDPIVLEAMLPFLQETYGNPSSIHSVGRRSRAALDDARERLAAQLLCKPGELVFTSGGTESNNLAIFGTARLRKEHGRHLISSSSEHHAVLHCIEYLVRHEGFEATLLAPNSEGWVDPEAVRIALREDTILVSLMAANNETGTIQSVSEVGDLCREREVCFHTDAVQWFGKEPFQGIDQFHADLVSICAHKFHGPKGAGVLFIRSPLQPHSILVGGGHEWERRAGTENLAGIIGLVKAAEHFISTPVFPANKLLPLRALLRQSLLAVEGVALTGAGEECLSNTVAVTVGGCDSLGLLAALDLEGICASSGAACSSGSLRPSHVLLSMGVPESLANSFVRFSLGRETTAEEIERVARIFPSLVGRLREFG